MAGLHLPIVEPPYTFEVQADPEIGEDYEVATTFQQPGCSKQAWLFRGSGLAGFVLIGVSSLAMFPRPSHTESLSGAALAFNPAMPAVRGTNIAGHPQVKGMSGQRRTPPVMHARSSMERTAFMPAMPEVNKGIAASSSSLRNSVPPAVQMSSTDGTWSRQPVEILYDPLQQPEQPQQPNGGSYSTLGWLSILAGATGGAFMAARKASQRRSALNGGLMTRTAQLRGGHTIMSATTGADAKPEIQVTPLDKAEAENTKGVSSWGTWGSPVEKFDWQWSGTEEAYILEGEATITPTGDYKDCKEVTIKAGDFCVFPGGMTCVWNVTKKLEKRYNYP